MSTVFAKGSIRMGMFFSLRLVYEWGGVRGLQPHVRTQNHGKWQVHPPPLVITCTTQMHSKVVFL